MCYLGDMLSQKGGCEHAILKRIQTGWLKFRELSSLLIGKGMSLKSKGIIYTTCIRPVMLYGIRTCWQLMTGEVMQQNRLRWFGHVERRDELCWLKRIETLQVDGNGVKDRPKKRWREVLREDMRKKGLCREDAWDRSRWKRMLWEGHRRG